MAELRFPRRAVAALFLERQHLARPRTQKIGAASLARFVGDVGGLQLDSINVVDRAHWLTLWSRFGELDRARFERLVYHDRLLFEYWAHAACLVPAADLAAWRQPMLVYRTGDRGWPEWLRRDRRILGEVEAAIRERGPLGNADFERAQQGPARTGWWSWKPETHALDFLWMSGRILVDERIHFQKRYALAERVLPELATTTPLSAAEFRRWHLRRSLHALGAATESDLRMYLTFPRFRAAERKKMLEAALRAGEIVPMTVESLVGRWFVLVEDVDALAAAAKRRRPSVGTTFLAPFDSFLWYRERTLRLFDFDYRIEVYTPAAKRRYGYYVLPILHDGKLVGRADVKNDRTAKRLELRRLVLEPGVDAAAVAPGIAEAAASLARFLDATNVRLGTASPPVLRAALRRLL